MARLSASRRRLGATKVAIPSGSHALSQGYQVWKRASSEYCNAATDGRRRVEGYSRAFRRKRRLR